MLYIIDSFYQQHNSKKGDFLFALFGSVIYNNVTEKGYVLQGLFLNTLADSETVLEMEQDFIETYPFDTSSEEVF